MTYGFKELDFILFNPKAKLLGFSRWRGIKGVEPSAQLHSTCGVCQSWDCPRKCVSRNGETQPDWSRLGGA